MDLYLTLCFNSILLKQPKYGFASTLCFNLILLKKPEYGFVFRLCCNLTRLENQFLYGYPLTGEEPYAERTIVLNVVKFK